MTKRKLSREERIYYAIQDEVANRCDDSEWIEGVFRDFFGETQMDEDAALVNIIEYEEFVPLYSPTKDAELAELTRLANKHGVQIEF